MGAWLLLLAGLGAAPVALAQDAEPPAEADPEPSDSDEDETEPAPATPAPRRVIQLAPTEPIPSALDDLEELAKQATDPEDREFWKSALELKKLSIGSPVRGMWFGRPRIAAGWASPTGGNLRGGVTLGGVVGHRWWPVRQPKRLEWGGESLLWAEGHVGGLKGATLGLSSTAGPWLGPIGISLGPRFDLTRYVVDGAIAPTAPMLGGQANVAVDAGSVMAWVGIAPMWSLNKSRLDGVGPLPTLGTETEWSGGVSVDFGTLQPRVHATYRSTSLGPVGTIGLGIQITPELGGSTKTEEEDP
ncbi:MAG: hypothetical protein AB8H79_15945 [Myxococcota bacterium]